MTNESSRPRVQSSLRVRYAETDRMGVVYHANYFVWFEIGRTDMCRAADVVYRELEESGFLLVVSESGARYLRPALYDDEITITTALTELGSRALRFDYEAWRGDERLVTGFTRHIFLDATSRKPVRAPAEVLAKFRAFVAPAPSPAKAPSAR